MDENILKKVSGPEKGFASVAEGKVSGKICFHLLVE